MDATTDTAVDGSDGGGDGEGGTGNGSARSARGSATGAPDAAAVALARDAVSRTFLSEAVRDYIVRLVGATRGIGAGGEAAAEVHQAASPRGTIALALACQARVWLDGREFAMPDDVVELAPGRAVGTDLARLPRPRRRRHAAPGRRADPRRDAPGLSGGTPQPP